MSNEQSLNVRVAGLDEPTAERLLQATLERLISSGGDLVVEDEDESRSLIASLTTQHDTKHQDDLRPDDVVPPSQPVDHYVAGVLQMLASDDASAPAVEESLDSLREERQMVVEPVTAALVLAAIVAFLQTKFDIRVSRKGGKTEFSFSASKKPTDVETIGEVIGVVRDVSVK